MAAVQVVGGANNTFAGCTFRNFIGGAGSIIGGCNNGFDSCDFYNMEYGFNLSGGDLKTLTRCNNYAINCDIYNLRNCGYGGFDFSGCGIIFKNNLYHDTNAAVQYKGAYIEFTNNEFYNVGWEMGDWNVLYQGADKWCNGNLMDNKFFHHMMEEPGRHPIKACRNDDGGSGTMYSNNIFYKTGRGAVGFGGPNTHIRNNVVLDCELIWWTAKTAKSPEEIQARYDEIAEQFESGRYPRGGKEDAIYSVEQIVGPKGWNNTPWSTAFPNFPKYMNENPFGQSYGSMLNNYHDRVSVSDSYNVVHIHGRWSLIPETGEKRYPTMADMPESFEYNAPQKVDLTKDFVDRRSLDFRFKPGFETMPGFKGCDMSKVGLYKTDYRPAPPSQKAYRSAIYNKYKFTPSSGGSYDHGKMYLRYPAHPWMPKDELEVTSYPYLSGLEAERELSHGFVRRDTNYSGKTLSLNGRIFDYGIMVCPVRSERKGFVEYDLTAFPKAKGFKAVVGIDDGAGANGSCVFTVKAYKDGTWLQLYKSPRMTGKDDGIDVDLDLKPYSRVRLVTTDAGDGVSSDHAIWADAQFTN